MTTLSVILPVHNGGPYLDDAVRSLVLNQRDDVEYLVIDDGSTDDTAEILDDARADLPQLSIITHDVAVGLADARNAGLDVASGRYLTFMDGDDWLRPGYLTELIDAMDALDVQFIRVDHIQAVGLTRRFHRAPQPRRGVALDPSDGIGRTNYSTMVDYPYAWAGVYRREMGELLRFPSGLHTAEDRPWIWRLHTEAVSYAAVSLAGLFYRRLVPNSLTQIGDRRQLDFIRSFAMVFDLVRDREDLLPKAVKQFLVVVAHHLNTAERFTDDLVQELHAGVRDVLAGVPDQLIEEHRLDDERHALLEPVLGSGLVAEPAE